MFEYAYIHIASSTLKKKRKMKKIKCYIKPGLSWSASLVHCKPQSMENKEGGVDRQGFSLPLCLADSWNKVLMHGDTVIRVIPMRFLEFWP